MHRCCFTGHRPEKLFLVDREIIKELEREIKAAIERGYTTFISGMARGVDIWAAEIVLNLRKKNKDLHLICASPYEGFESRWSQDWQKRYKKIIKKSDYVKYVSPEYSPACFQIRNEYMVDHSIEFNRNEDKYQCQSDTRYFGTSRYFNYNEYLH